MRYELSQKEEVVYQMRLLPKRYFLHNEHRYFITAAPVNDLLVIKLRIVEIECWMISHLILYNFYCHFLEEICWSA
jgi:hypothetical protein